MASQLHNLSEYDRDTLPDASAMRIAIVVAEWNEEITGNLLQGAHDALIEAGVRPENITVVHVPGSFELIYGAKRLAEKIKPDAVIGLGCVIRGETPHFEYICSGVAQGFAALNAAGTIPYIFGLLTDNTLQQSIDRSGGKLGNKGTEAAVTAIKMVALACKLK
jgi:6,7-dimethyl-8-ribityllumazine synthase